MADVVLLDKYLAKGWLVFGCGLYSAEDRAKAGKRLAEDYYLSRFVSSGIIDYTKPRVDSSIVNSISDSAMDARQRYIQAMRALNNKQAFVIRKICVENEPVKIPNIYAAQYRHDIELLKSELCGGLDALVNHYWGKVYTRRPKITATVGASFWEDFDEWYKGMSL